MSLSRRDFLKRFGQGMAGAVVASAITQEALDAVAAMEPVFEDEQYEYYWYNKAEMDVRREFEDRLEAQLMGVDSYDEGRTFEATKGVIVKDKFEVTGSEMVQIQWIKVPK